MARDGATSMRFRVLGPVEATGPDGAPLSLSNHQRAFVAALLARRGHVVSTDLLTELLWGDEPPANPMGALHNLVSPGAPAAR
jgi:DNA-binding SARP family transcriptional activator